MLISGANLAVGQIWIPVQSGLTSLNRSSASSNLTIFGINGVGAQNDTNRVVSFVRVVTLGGDVSLRATNSAGGGFSFNTMIAATPSSITLNGHTLTLDTVNSANTMYFSPAYGVTGNGNVIKTGEGTVTFDNTLDASGVPNIATVYTGSTSILQGTLALVRQGSIATSSNVLVNGTLDISATDNGATVNWLSGNGSVVLGDKTLHLAQRGNVFNGSTSSTFAGTISGNGAVEQAGGGTIVLTGNNLYTGGTTISAGALQLGNGGSSGAVVGNIVNNSALVFNRADVYTSNNVISGMGTVTQAGPGVTVLNATSPYTGDTTVAFGTLAIGDAAHTAARIGSATTNVAPGATFGGYGSTEGSVVNSGTVAVAKALSAFSSGNVGAFRIGGNYTGQNGQLALNTVLNGGGAATQSDQLIVNGNTYGITSLTLLTSGSGAKTVGDGIMLVQVGGQSAAGSFRLAGAVQAGAYQYLLYQGGAASQNNWYLRSTYEAADTSAGPSTPGQQPAAGPAAAVAYRPGTVAYSLTPALSLDYGFSAAGRLHERVGNVTNIDEGQPGNAGGIWGRVGGQNLDANSAGRYGISQRSAFVEFGRDWTLERNDSGASTHAGVTVRLGSSSAHFDDSARRLNPTLSRATGSVDTQAQTLGGYWTRYLPDGTYFDGVGQITHYRNKYDDVYGGKASQNGFGAVISSEVGKTFALGSTSAVIEPQAQLLYQYLHLNGFSDSVSPVSGTTTNALRGRFGFRLAPVALRNAAGGGATPYLSADVLHDFFSPGQTRVADVAFDNTLNKTWYELGLGVMASLGKSSWLYANVKYAHNIGGDYRQNVFGQAGYRYSW